MDYADEIIDTLVENENTNNRSYEELSNTMDEMYVFLTDELEYNIKRAVENNKKFIILYSYEKYQTFNGQKIYYVMKDCSKFMKRYGKTNLIERLEKHHLISNFKLEHYYNKKKNLNELKLVFVEETDESRYRRYLRNKKK